MIKVKKRGKFMRILLIEDDRDLCEALSFELKSEGFTVDVCNDGEDGLQYVRQEAHDLILLDRMLPSLNGIQILQAMRSEGISISVILITALGEVADKIKGLDSGADDYIVKPFEFGELMARIRSISRRPKQMENNHLLEFGDISYNTDEKILISKELTCHLSKKEGDLLELFLRNPNKTLPRLTILTRVWGPYAEIEEGNLDNYIHFLRKRLISLRSKSVITTMRGVGYRLEECDV